MITASRCIRWRSGSGSEIKLREQSIFNSEVRELSRLYVSSARDVSIDAAGRMLILPEVRTASGLSKAVTLVGGGLPQFEAWDCGRFEIRASTRGQAAVAVRAAVASWNIATPRRSSLGREPARDSVPVTVCATPTRQFVTRIARRPSQRRKWFRLPMQWAYDRS